MRRLALVLAVCGALLVDGCSSSSPPRGSDGSVSDAPLGDGARGSDIVASDAPLGDGTRGSDIVASDAPLVDGARANDALGMDASGADRADGGSMDGSSAADADAGRPAWVDPFGGASGCPNGGFPVAAPNCGLDMPVSGGVSTVAGDYCRNSASTSYFWYGTNGINPDVEIHVAQPLVRGATAANLRASVSLIDRTIGGSADTWSTPADGCTVTIHSNVCWIYLAATYYLISGTGSCSAPATTTPAKLAKPVTIGDFSFTYTIFP